MTYIPQSWHVEVQGQIYGPYSTDQMSDFVREGRILAQSKITHDLKEGFYAAIAYPSFKSWLQAANIAPLDLAKPIGGAPSSVPAAPRAPASGFGRKAAARSAAQHDTVFLVMAEIGSGQAMKFLHALQKLGTAQRIGDTLWLLKAAQSAEQVRDYLAQTLTRNDRLFILDSINNRPAWHNIGADMDSRIREFWYDTT